MSRDPVIISAVVPIGLSSFEAMNMPPVSAELSVAEYLAFSTIRIETESDGLRGYGTGFFFSYSLGEQQQVPVIVTNRHVIEDASTAYLKFTRADAQGRPRIGDCITVGDHVAGTAVCHESPNPPGRCGWKFVKVPHDRLEAAHCRRQMRLVADRIH